MRSSAILFVLAIGVAAPVSAQDESSGAVQSSPLPTAKILRPPSDDSGAERLGTGQDSTSGAEDTGATIETQPLSDLTPSTADTGQETNQDARQTPDNTGTDAAQSDPAQGVNGDDPLTGPLATDPAQGDEQGGAQGDAIAVLRPRGVEEPSEDEAEENAEDAGDGKTRWQRARARRFKLAPKTHGTLTFNTPAPIVPIAAVSTELKTGARLRQLDKMTGQTQTFEIAVGESRKVARLNIRLDACRAPSNNDIFGTMAFVQVWDTKPKDDPEPEFSGWMFADSPALSALDHPRYDLWVINCNTVSAEASTGSE